MSDYWGSQEQPYSHPGANLSVDMIVRHRGRVLLIERGDEPHKGAWALPGGGQETDALPGQPWRPGRESAREAALRELQEEAGIDPEIAENYLEPLDIFDRFGRDPRDNDEAWSVSQVFLVTLPDDIEIEAQAGSDAARASWFSAEELEELNLAFDHKEMLVRAGSYSEGNT